MLEKIIQDKIGDWAIKGSMDASLINHPVKINSISKKNYRRSQRLSRSKKVENNLQLVLF